MADAVIAATRECSERAPSTGFTAASSLALTAKGNPLASPLKVQGLHNLAAQEEAA